jgi:prolyl-tRNA synthetase
MRMSELFFTTLREDPADAEMPSHRLLLRAGYIRPLGAGIYSLLPLGMRVNMRVTQVIREEMNAIGAQGVHVPFRGSAPAVTEVMSGRIPALFENLPPMAAQLRGGTLRGLEHRELGRRA